MSSQETHLAKVTAIRGGNLFTAVIAPSLDSLIISLPNKFNKTKWIKLSSFVKISLNTHANTTKVGGEIVDVLDIGDVKQMKKNGEW